MVVADTHFETLAMPGYTGYNHFPTYDIRECWKFLMALRGSGIRYPNPVYCSDSIEFLDAYVAELP